MRFGKLETRSAVSSKGFLDDQNLERQELQTATRIFPRFAGVDGAVAFAQILWVNHLASTFKIVPYRVQLQNALTVPTAHQEYQHEEMLFDEMLNPIPIDLATYERIRSLMNAPYIRRFDFQPLFDD